MTQDEAVSVIKAIIRKKSRLRVSRRQIFLTKHEKLEGGVDRLFFGVTIEGNARAKFYAGLAVDWGASVASGLAPTPTGVTAPAISAASVAGGLGSKMPGAIDAKFTAAYNSGLKSLTPVAEGTTDQFAINGSYLVAQKWADNVGMFGVMDVSAASVKWRATDMFRQYALWKDKMSNDADLTDLSDTFPLGTHSGTRVILMDGSWVRY
jgi:hypothetical protein